MVFYTTSSPNSSLCGLAFKNNCFTSPIRLGWMCILDFSFKLLSWWLWFTYTILLVHWMNSKLFFMFFTLQFKIWKVWKLWVLGGLRPTFTDQGWGTAPLPPVYTLVVCRREIDDFAAKFANKLTYFQTMYFFKTLSFGTVFGIYKKI